MSKPAVSGSRERFLDLAEMREAVCDYCRIDGPPTLDRGLWMHLFPPDEGNSLCGAGRIWQAAERETRERCEPKWISVEERLPEPNAYVFFWQTETSGGWHVGYYRVDEPFGKCWESERTDSYNQPIEFDTDLVTHWMLADLPSPSRKGEV